MAKYVTLRKEQNLHTDAKDPVFTKEMLEKATSGYLNAESKHINESLWYSVDWEYKDDEGDSCSDSEHFKNYDEAMSCFNKHKKKGYYTMIGEYDCDIKKPDWNARVRHLDSSSTKWEKDILVNEGLFDSILKGAAKSTKRTVVNQAVKTATGGMAGGMGKNIAQGALKGLLKEGLNESVAIANTESVFDDLFAEAKEKGHGSQKHAAMIYNKALKNNGIGKMADVFDIGKKESVIKDFWKYISEKEEPVNEFSFDYFMPNCLKKGINTVKDIKKALLNEAEKKNHFNKEALEMLKKYQNPSSLWQFSKLLNAMKPLADKAVNGKDVDHNLIYKTLENLSDECEWLSKFFQKEMKIIALHTSYKD